MSEDERYRTSTQYRLWSYTPSALSNLRATTNRIAADRVREAVQRARESQSRVVSSAETSEAENGSRAVSAIPEGEVDCLTVEEELKLVVFYCRQTIQLGDHLKVPTDVKATAIQYIKRFYVTNSLMTYHPTTILKTALFFATKTENHYFRLSKFADAIGKTTPEDVLACEFLLTQGLRFTFDVRHPFRALEGAVMELQAIANGDLKVDGEKKWEGREMEKRVKEAHGKAREYLKTSALLTDVYFHYTPSQIMFSSLLLADRDLITWYIGIKFPITPNNTTPTLAQKVLKTLESCATMLQSIEPSSQPSGDELKELKRLAKKLNKCRNPDKMDLVGLQRAKREGDGGVGEEDKAVKKRKMERDKVVKEGEELFGPSMQRESS